MNVFLLAILCTIVHVPAVGLRYSPFHRLATQKQKKLLGIVYAALLVMNLVFYLFFASKGLVDVLFYRYNLMTFGLLTTIANIFVIRDRAQEHLYVMGLDALWATVFPIFMSLVSQNWTTADLAMTIGVNAAGTTILYLAFYLLLRRILRDSIASFREMDGWWRLTWLVPIALYLANVIFYLPNTYAVTLRQFIGQLLFVVAAVLLCRNMICKNWRLTEKLQMAQQLDMQKQYYASLSQQVEEARKDQRDATHQVEKLERLVAAKDQVGLTELCRNLIQTRYANGQIPSCDNAAADGVLYHYAQLADKAGIQFECSGTLKNTDVADLDLCAILNNALDNAMANCQNVPEDRQRFVSVAIQSKEYILSIVVRNSYYGIVEESVVQPAAHQRDPKQNSAFSCLKKICERYGGGMNVQWNSDSFMVAFLLSLKH